MSKTVAAGRIGGRGEDGRQDSMSVAFSRGVPNWTITVTDDTSFTTQQACAGRMTSAGWVQGAPTVGAPLRKLATDSAVVFDSGTVNGTSPGLVGSEAGAMFPGRKQISTPSLPGTDSGLMASSWPTASSLPLRLIHSGHRNVDRKAVLIGTYSQLMQRTWSALDEPRLNWGFPYLLAVTTMREVGRNGVPTGLRATRPIVSCSRSDHVPFTFGTPLVHLVQTS